MRDLAIAYGNNRQAKKWINKIIKYEDLKERLKVTIRTAESAEEYAKMSKVQRDAAKDHGGFVGGALIGRSSIPTNRMRHTPLAFTPYIPSRRRILAQGWSFRCCGTSLRRSS